MSCEHCSELELELAALRKERDMLLAQRSGTQAWLGELLHGSPIGPVTREDQVASMADKLAAKYPDQKIMAIKDLRNTAPRFEDGRMFGLKEAKDAMDDAYARARLAQSRGHL